MSDTGRCSEMYEGVDRLQYGPCKRTSIAGVCQLKSSACKSQICGPNSGYCCYRHDREGILSVDTTQNTSGAQVIMATLQTLTTLSRSLSPPHVPVSERRGPTRSSLSITIFIRRFGRQNTIVSTVVSPSRVNALHRACALLDAG